MSIRLSAQEVTHGLEGVVLPRAPNEARPVPVLNEPPASWLSVPRTMTAISCGRHFTVAGVSRRLTLRLFTGDQVVPSNDWCSRALPWPWANTSNRFGWVDATLGAEVKLPPRFSHRLN